MKLKFQSNLQYQNDAINSVVDIFKGQQSRQSNFTVLNSSNINENQQQIGVVYTNTGIGNSLDLTYDDVLENVQKIQMRNNLKRSEKLEGMKKACKSFDKNDSTKNIFLLINELIEKNIIINKQ